MSSLSPKQVNERLQGLAILTNELPSRIKACLLTELINALMNNEYDANMINSKVAFKWSEQVVNTESDSSPNMWMECFAVIIKVRQQSIQHFETMLPSESKVYSNGSLGYYPLEIMSAQIRVIECVLKETNDTSEFRSGIKAMLDLMHNVPEMDRSPNLMNAQGIMKAYNKELAEKIATHWGNDKVARELKASNGACLLPTPTCADLLKVLHFPDPQWFGYFRLKQVESRPDQFCVYQCLFWHIAMSRIGLKCTSLVHPIHIILRLSGVEQWLQNKTQEDPKNTALKEFLIVVREYIPRNYARQKNEYTVAELECVSKSLKNCIPCTHFHT